MIHGMKAGKALWFFFFFWKHPLTELWAVLFPNLIILSIIVGTPQYNTIEAAAFGNSAWNVCTRARPHEMFVPSFWLCTQQSSVSLCCFFVDLFIYMSRVYVPCITHLVSYVLDTLNQSNGICVDSSLC